MGPATTDVLALLSWRTCREAPFKNSFSSASLPTRRSSAADARLIVGQHIRGSGVAVEPAGIVLGDTDLDQVTADAVALGEGVGRLSAQELLDDLTLELDRMRAVLSPGLSPRM